MGELCCKYSWVKDEDPISFLWRVFTDMTEASKLALQGMRDFSTLEWYVIPLLAIVFYIYTSEMKKARASGNWNAIFAGLTVFGMDFINETWNGWVFYLTQRSAFWTVPGKTALRTMVGWNY